MIRTVLGLCARDTAPAGMMAALDRQLSLWQPDLRAWEALVRAAEEHGLSPLVHKHLSALGILLPDGPRRQLQALVLRHRRAAAIRRQAVAEVLLAYREARIEVLLVKGIALGGLVYTEPGLRPMRDIDLLVSAADAARAEAILFDLGYAHEPGHDIPADYYHLPPAVKTVAGLPVNIELHKNLLPLHPQYPRWPLERSLDTATPLEIDGVPARTLCLEEMLVHVYLHGFRPPLTYEPFRFVHVADLVSLVERFVDTVRWPRVRALCPEMDTVLAALHSLTPWSADVVDRLALPLRAHTDRPGVPYRGWPQRRLRTVAWREVPGLVRDTLWPSGWWVQVHYGRAHGSGYWRTRLLDHPRRLLGWVRAYWHAFRVRRGRPAPSADKT